MVDETSDDWNFDATIHEIIVWCAKNKITPDEPVKIIRRNKNILRQKLTEDIGEIIHKMIVDNKSHCGYHHDILNAIDKRIGSVSFISYKGPKNNKGEVKKNAR